MASPNMAFCPGLVALKHPAAILVVCGVGEVTNLAIGLACLVVGIALRWRYAADAATLRALVGGRL